MSLGQQSPVDPPPVGTLTTATISSVTSIDNSRSGTVTAHMKEYNLNTYKHHLLGDYTPSIRSVGTLDSYTTRNGELEHRNGKRRFDRTSKKNFVPQLADIERREDNLRRIAHAVADMSESPSAGEADTYRHAPENSSSTSRGDTLPFSDPEDLAAFPASDHHHIAKSQKNFVYLPHHLHRHQGDPALKDFLPKLQTHLLACLRDNLTATNNTFTESDRRDLIIENDRIYSHQFLRINYTTYDVRRGQDLVNPSTERCDIMMLANEGLHTSDTSDNNTTGRLFWYARVLGIYHANIVDLRNGPLAIPRRMEFLFVRWFGRDPEWKAGWTVRRLDQIGFVPESDPDAFGFVNPGDVIRACHLIPAFAKGRTNLLLGKSKIARPSGACDDWERFYVNRDVTICLPEHLSTDLSSVLDKIC
ncbi:hypothetical protein BN946_scf184708.g3 [Trametes cinnabarina]|uniref:Uncharacterized protein n=1 Tax=Pycnoporus cinnabarinus TaxID=5643 RepID=A0A060T0K6_PYCCI|nr:hypothetical protein BN946_scf184708.g3 [Trametes cinnabarina]